MVGEPPPESEGIYACRKKPPAADLKIKNEPLPPGTRPARVMEAPFYRPYQMHGSIGTSAAIATLNPDGILTIHTHSQSVFETAAAIARMLGMDEKKVRAIHVQGSGCYGHNMAD